MSKKSWIISGVGAGALIIAGAGALTIGGEVVPTTINPAEGGEWSYGASGGRTWSYFQHEKSHSASVQGHDYVDTGCLDGRTWARAQTHSRWISILGNEQDKEVCS
ncbi:lactococcin 972 family bacteriocin [Corynebacterium sp. sy039]|uniref:lactococcin 972 family bacteriocin n=1 Tax=Corynebacterium sp. sy039 TaxID=2599641 RepID=UPI0011B3D8BE|nr:lactococcin 972 family bacteriocin [Corynebacterium sp. sy039]QDZ42496.1 hypothetical protein FQV43_04450 [Corynebacterium sp. sy039]